MVQKVEASAGLILYVAKGLQAGGDHTSFRRIKVIDDDADVVLRSRCFGARAGAVTLPTGRSAIAVQPFSAA